MPQPTGESSEPDLANAKTVLSMPVASLPDVDGDCGDAKRSQRESRLLVLCDSVERLVASRRLTSLATLAFFGGIGGPVADVLQGNQQPVWTVVLSNAMLLLLWAVFFGWLGAIRDEGCAFTGQAVTLRCKVLWRACLEGYLELLESDPRIRWASLGAHLVFVASLLFGLRGIAIVVAVSVGYNAPPTDTLAGMFWVGLAAFVLGVALLTKAAMGVGNASPEAAQLARASLANLPPIIDFTRDTERQFGDGDPLSATLSALSKWRARRARSYDDAYAYQVALGRLLRSRVGRLKCRRAVWLGSARACGIADLVLGGFLVIHVTKGFSAENASHAIEQIRAYQRRWPKRPKLLVVFDAEQRDVFEKATVAALQNLREETATITVRM